jgi:hypothetical protein
VDVEFEKVEKLVGYEFNGAVDIVLEAEMEFERSLGLGAEGEGYVLELTRGVCDL